MIWRSIGIKAAIDALSYVAPVGQEEEYISSAVAIDSEYIAEERLSGATAVCCGFNPNFLASAA